MKRVQAKKIYNRPCSDVFDTCQSALLELRNVVIELKENCLCVNTFFLPQFFGYSAEIRVVKLSDTETETSVSMKAGVLVPWSRAARIVKDIFKNIEAFLKYQEWQKRIYMQSPGMNLH